jgi:hypothetical protein
MLEARPSWQRVPVETHLDTTIFPWLHLQNKERQTSEVRTNPQTLQHAPDLPFRYDVGRWEILKGEFE